ISAHEGKILLCLWPGFLHVSRLCQNPPKAVLELLEYGIEIREHALDVPPSCARTAERSAVLNVLRDVLVAVFAMLPILLMHRFGAIDQPLTLGQVHILDGPPIRAVDDEVRHPRPLVGEEPEQVPHVQQEALNTQIE